MERRFRAVGRPDRVAAEGRPGRFGTLSQAAWTSYFERRDVDVIGRIVAGLNDPGEADAVLCDAAERIARYGTPGHAAERLGRVKSPRRAIQASCQVARGLAEGPGPEADP